VYFIDLAAAENEVISDVEWTERKKRVRSAILTTDSEESEEELEEDLPDSDFSEHSLPSSPKASKPKKKVPVRQEAIEEWIPEPRLAPEWLTKNHYVWTPYLPQMQDEVIYIKQGHMEFAEKNAAYYPFIIDDGLPDLLKGKVIGISFQPGAIVYCTVTLAIYPQMTNSIDDVSHLATTDISFFDAPDAPDFLILFEDFEVSKDTQWEVGSKAMARYGDGEFEAMIVDINDSQTPWAKYGVKFENQEDIIRFSPWELRPLEKPFASLRGLGDEGIWRLQ
jgi:hypothetical protein